MSPDMEKIRKEVALSLCEQILRSEPYTRQQLVNKLVDQLPDDFVFCLHIAYDFYKDMQK
jgi:hypothetical protein